MAVITQYRGNVIPSSRNTGQFSDLNSRAATARSYAGPRAMLQVHEDSPQPVLDVFDATQRELYFQFFEVPIAESGGSPKYEQICVPGRSEDYYAYGGNTNNTYALELVFARSAFEGEDAVSDDVCLACARWIQALQYPTSVGGIIYPPPLCRLIIGKFVSARGVVTDVEIKHDAPFYNVNPAERPLDYPGICQVSFTFTALNKTPRQAFDVIHG